MEEETYVDKRERFVTEFLNNVIREYGEQSELYDRAVGLTTTLDMADPAPEFIDDLLGLMAYSSMMGHKTSAVLVTIFHDLREFEEHRKEDWFCPRCSRYSKYLTGAGGAPVK